MVLCVVMCVLSSSMRVSGEAHLTTCVFGSFRKVGCVTTFIAAITEALKTVRSTQALLSFLIQSLYANVSR